MKAERVDEGSDDLDARISRLRGKRVRIRRRRGTGPAEDLVGVLERVTDDGQVVVRVHAAHVQAVWPAEIDEIDEEASGE